MNCNTVKNLWISSAERDELNFFQQEGSPPGARDSLSPLVPPEGTGYRKLFTCINCGLSFTRKASWKRHIDSVHGQVRHVCSDCGNSYSRRDSLQRHRNARHNN